MSLNYSLIAKMLDPNVRLVGCRFIDEAAGALKGRVYSYKCADPNVDVGDYVVVFVGNTPKIIQVVELDCEPHDEIQYRWIVQRLSSENYRANLKKEEEVAKKLRAMEHENKQKQVLEALGEDNFDALKGITFQG